MSQWSVNVFLTVAVFHIYCSLSLCFVFFFARFVRSLCSFSHFLSRCSCCNNLHKMLPQHVPHKYNNSNNLCSVYFTLSFFFLCRCAFTRAHVFKWKCLPLARILAVSFMFRVFFSWILLNVNARKSHRNERM